ncbi:hybrid sensor histidine kinase/response regulator [Haloarcula onubensis]|uniref:histidine kinase n=1 Tax=Haloarcula onubensis TaxID=2950539 RepID=A0ABU2FUY1_9EURY|nr:response regulator [Halomicroarcula sp. S3CR25-11]MDS0284573.1 response regulator [Halomicroarcula sp. S3CR25-11]
MDSRIRVLHVDDDPEFRDLTAELLERENDRFDVRTAAGPTEGRTQLESGEFDCVVSDFDMPGESGIAFLETVRGDYPDLPFILFTGKGSEEVASEAISAGVTDYLQKTIGAEQYELLANRIATAVDQYRTARELERQNDLFEKAESIGNVGAWEYDIVSDTSYVSDEVLRIHGLDTDAHLTPEETIEYFHPDDREQLRGAFRAAIDAGRSYDLELRMRDADGRQRWIRTRGEPQSEDGDIVRVRGILQDITDQKRRERKLERQNARLEEFAHVVSHDIRNPLQVASGQLELARQTGDPTAFAGAEDALNRIETIVENILTLARHGRTVDETEPVPLAAVAREAWETVETGGLALSVDSEVELAADRERLRQLLENLVANTVEHGEGAETIRIGEIQPLYTATRADGDTTNGFYVADDGVGIPEGIRDEVFDSGFTTAAESTGFGLAIVAQVAEAHGWETAVTDSRDGGARFEFTEGPAGGTG